MAKPTVYARAIRTRIAEALAARFGAAAKSKHRNTELEVLKAAIRPGWKR